MPHLNYALSTEIRETVGKLPPWKGDPSEKAIDYTGAPIAYAVNVTLIHGALERHPIGVYLPTAETNVLLVERASGDGRRGSWSGVSGYIDVLHDPKDQLTDEAFDPVAYAAKAELNEECDIPWEESSTIDLHLGALFRPAVNLALGNRFVEVRFNGHGTIVVAPILGMCHEVEPPDIRPNPKELREYHWVPLGEVASHPNLSEGYLDNTLPHSLGSIGLRPQAIHTLIYPGTV